MGRDLTSSVTYYDNKNPSSGKIAISVVLSNKETTQIIKSCTVIDGLSRRLQRQERINKE